MKELFDKIGIEVNNLTYYYTAFSHSSYVYENNIKNDYERLEFLGDKVLDLIISDYLYTTTNEKEGDMTKKRASYVCANACYTYAYNLGFSKYIKLGRGEEESGGRYKKVILADIFEAFTGAIYLDLGYDVAKKVILDIIVPYINDPTVNFLVDYKSELQEIIQEEQKSINYELLKEEGPAHNKQFTIAVKINEILYGVGSSSSKKDAEQEAAKDALSKLIKEV